MVLAYGVQLSSKVVGFLNTFPPLLRRKARFRSVNHLLNIFFVIPANGECQHLQAYDLPCVETLLPLALCFPKDAKHPCSTVLPGSPCSPQPCLRRSPACPPSCSPSFPLRHPQVLPRVSPRRIAGRPWPLAIGFACP